MAEKSIDCFALATLVGDVAHAVFTLRLKVQVAGGDGSKLEDLEDDLRAKANELSNLGVVALGDEFAGSTTRIGASIKKAKAAIEEINKVKKAIAIATAVLGIATSVLGGDFAAAFQDAVALSEKLKADQG